MTIIQDTREQTPLPFASLAAPPKVEIATLKTGDYSIKGREDMVAIERKSIGDLVNTLVRSKARFGRELERMRPYKYRAIVVEGTWRDIENRRYRSQVHPNAVRGLVNWIWVSAGIPTFFVDDPEMAAAWVASTCRLIEKQEEKLEASKPSEPTVS